MFNFLGTIFHGVSNLLVFGLILKPFLVIWFLFFPAASAKIPPQPVTSNQIIHASKQRFQPAPSEIKKEGREIFVTIPINRIEQDIFNDFVISGICNNAWINKSDLKSAKLINVLNKHSYQGIVFENSSNTCTEINSKSGQDQIYSILGSSHWYSH